MGFLDETVKDFSSHVDYISCLDQLRKSELFDKLPEVKEVFNNPIVDQYFQRGLVENCKEDASVEKNIAVAAAQMASEKFGWNRENSIQLATSTADLLREARRNYKLQKGEISQEEYNEHKNSAFWSSMYAGAKALWKNCNSRVKEWVKDKAIGWVLAKATALTTMPVVGPIIGAVASVGATVWAVIPQPAKKIVKEGAKKAVDWCVDNIDKVAKKAYEVAKPIVKKSAKIIAKGAEIGVKAVGKVASSIWQGAKNVVSSVASAAKSAISTFLSWF